MEKRGTPPSPSRARPGRKPGILTELAYKDLPNFAANLAAVGEQRL